MKANGPVRMSRSPGGGASYGKLGCGHGGPKGMGSRFSGWRGNDHKRNKLSWKDPAMVRDKTQKVTSGAMKTQADRFSKLSTNPSGAPATRGATA
jgi:hypothetical protein